MTIRFPQAHAFDCISPNKQQQMLSDRFLTPNIENIMAGIAKIRARIDEHFETLKAKAHSEPQADHLAGLIDIKMYPYGFCERIRDMVWNSLHTNLKNPNAGQGHFTELRTFIHEGGLFRKIWGELTHGPYFQNAIQVGSYYLDASNDTVVTTKPKLEILPLAQTNFQNIDSFEQYFDVASTYYQWETYPNSFLPNLTPLYPGVAIHKQSKAMLICDVPLPLMYKNMESRGQMAMRFLKHSSYSQKSMPSQYLDLLTKHQNTIWRKRNQSVVTAHPTEFELFPLNDSKQKIADALRRLETWIAENHRQAVYETALVKLDRNRKIFDRSLRRYTTSRPSP